MKTSNFPYKRYLRRVGALERLGPLDHGVGSERRKKEAAILDERIKGYAELGNRPKRGLYD